MSVHETQPPPQAAWETGAGAPHNTRRGELCNARKEHVDLTRAEWLIPEDVASNPYSRRQARNAN
jgi:hypothetical protein